MPLPSKANVSRPLAEGYGALVEYGPNPADSLYLRLAVSPGRQLAFQTVPPEQRSPDVADIPEEMRAESGQTFGRNDFGGGEGLRHAHRRDGTPRDFTRYYDSKSISIIPSAQSGEAATLRLSRTSTRIRQNTAGLAGWQTILVDGSLYSTTTLNRVDVTDDPTATTPTWTSENPHAGEGDDRVHSLTSLGLEIYAAVEANGIHKRSTGGTWSHWSDLGAGGASFNIKAAKERILAWAGGQLYEARAATGSVLLSNQASSDRWHGVADAGSHIVAVNRNGYAYMWAEEEGELVLQGQTKIAASTDEHCFSVEAVAGLVFVGTGEEQSDGTHIGRIYRGILIGGQIRELQLLRTWDTSQVLGVPWRLARTRDFVYWSIQTAINTAEIWKYSLLTGGVFRDLTIVETTGGSTTGAHSILSIDDRLFVHIGSGTSAGIFREDAASYEDSGYLISPLVDFYNAGRKAWMGGRLQTGDLPTGTQIDLYYATDPAALDDPAHASWTLLATADPANPGDSAEAALTAVESRAIALKAVLTPNGANTSTPELLAFAVRGISKVTEEDYGLPVNISDRLELPGRKPLIIPNAGDAVYDKLRSLIGSAATVTLLRPDESVVGQLKDLSTPITGIPEQGSPTVYTQLIIRGARQ